MAKISRWVVLFFFVLVLAGPIFAQEEETEDIVLTEELEEGVVIGNVVGLDTEAETITVKTTEGTEEIFYVVQEETILWRGIEDIELADVKIGEDAEVGYYTDESGKLIASWVDVVIEEEVVPLEIETEEEPEVESEADTSAEQPEVAPEAGIEEITEE